jgi:hypothetical protein
LRDAPVSASQVAATTSSNVFRLPVCLIGGSLKSTSGMPSYGSIS